MAIICVYQQTQHDLVNADAEINRERDICLEYVRSLFAHLADFFTRKRGVFFDFADPPSGSPVFSQAGPALFPDVDSHHRLLKYPITFVGTCGLVSHPNWRTRCYPSTGFVGSDGVEAFLEWVKNSEEDGDEVEMNELLVKMLKEEEERAGRAAKEQ
jgi:hypothetical protein